MLWLGYLMPRASWHLDCDNELLLVMGGSGQGDTARLPPIGEFW